MKVGDIIKIRSGHQQNRTSGPRITKIMVLAGKRIKINFADQLNMGLELFEDLQIERIIIFDGRAGKTGEAVGLLFSRPFGEGPKFVFSEKFPGARLMERIEALKQRLAKMSDDNDLLTISKNLDQILGTSGSGKN